MIWYIVHGLYLFLYIYIYICTCWCVCVYIYIYTCVCICIYVYRYIYICIDMRVCDLVSDTAGTLLLSALGRTCFSSALCSDPQVQRSL